MMRAMARAKAPSKAPPRVQPVSLTRERSWLAFNHRVLLQATRPDFPLLERVRFLTIFANNLDEFFTARISGAQERGRADERHRKAYLDLLEVARVSQRLASDIWAGLLEELRAVKIAVLRWDDLETDEQAFFGAYLAESVAPLTDLIAAEGVNFLDSRALYLAAGNGGLQFVLRVPEARSRLLEVPGRAGVFVRLEDLIIARSDLFLPEALPMYTMRVTRRAQIELRGNVDWEDLAHALESRLDGAISRLEVETGFPWLEALRERLGLLPEEVYTLPAPLDHRLLEPICDVPRPELRFKPLPPRKRTKFHQHPSTYLEKQDLALYHPSDDYDTVVNFVLQMARDPHVTAMRATLYRLGRKNPIAEALLEAAARGKDVAVFLEGRARFDELANLYWQLRFRHGGVRVLPYPPDLKVHAKALYVQRGGKGFVHLGTGNYNPATGKLYTDLSLLSASKRLSRDAAEFFSALEESRFPQLQWMKVGVQARDMLIERIDEEAHPNGHIILKLNHLTDPAVLKALSSAAEAGANVELIVRSTLTLLHPKFKARSLVGRYLEHARIAAFKRHGDWEVWAGSADWMPRNFEKRLELVFPILDKKVRTKVLKLLNAQMQDDQNAFILEPTGETARWGGSRNSQVLKL
jgi:polyphosphate kinase